MKAINFKKIISSAYIIVIILGLSVSAITFFLGRSVTKTSDALLERNIPLLIDVFELKIAALQSEPILYEYYATVDRARFLERYQVNVKAINSGLEMIRNEFGVDSNINEISSQFDKLDALSSRLDGVMNADKINWDNAREILLLISETARDVDLLLDRLVINIQARVEEGKLLASDKTEMIVETVLLFSVIISMIAIFLIRNVYHRLGTDPSELVKIAKSLEVGRLDIHREKELRGVYASINKTVKKLKDVISSIKSASEKVTNASLHITQSNVNLNQRTQEQASNLEEMASTMEEMMSTVQNNVDRTQQTHQLTITAREKANEGGAVVKNAILSMDEINTASGKISEIISVIDEIAFQTNLLALNASVEAARAGAQGRGFAVVAAEVRSLAGQSAAAAKNIKKLIQDSVQKVKDGTRLVNETGTVLEEIVTAVNKVGDLVEEVTCASREQSGGIEQVNTALVHIDDMTQQNATLVEQATAAAEAMAIQANELNDLIAFFKLEGEKISYDENGTVGSGMTSVSNESTANKELIAINAQQSEMIPRK